MSDMDIEKYCAYAVERSATSAKQINPDTIVTAAWVRMKCQFGCPEYGKGYACPPHTPTPEQTMEIIDCYHRSYSISSFPRRLIAENAFQDFLQC